MISQELIDQYPEIIDEKIIADKSFLTKDSFEGNEIIFLNNLIVVFRIRVLTESEDPCVFIKREFSVTYQTPNSNIRFYYGRQQASGVEMFHEDLRNFQICSYHFDFIERDMDERSAEVAIIQRDKLLEKLKNCKTDEQRQKILMPLIQ